MRRSGALQLPAAGYQGDPPTFPLPDGSDRELDVWREAWKSPQAFAWSTESWRWYTVAMWTRWTVRAEDPKAPAAIGTVVVRLADQIGLTPAGLEENGWRVADLDDASIKVTPADRGSPRDRFRADRQPTSLDRARQRAEERARDPRAVLSQDWTPDDAG